MFNFVFKICSYLFILISKERGQTSRGIIDIQTRLASRDTSILCRRALKILLKKGQNNYKRGGLGQNPQKKNIKKQTTNKTKKNQKQIMDIHN